MSESQTLLLGFIAGVTILFGLPIGRMRTPRPGLRQFLNALAIGIPPQGTEVAVDVNAATFMTFQAYGIAAAIYLGVTFLLVSLFRKAERRWLGYLQPQTVQAHPRPKELPC